jgi:hypothetical protein
MGSSRYASKPVMRMATISSEVATGRRMKMRDTFMKYQSK